MKKLMTVVSVTATLLAFGAVNGDVLTSTGFETEGSFPAYVAGQDLNTAKDDAGAVDGDGDFAATWVSTNLEEGVAIVTAYDGEGAAAKADVAAATGVAAADLGSNYLKLDGAPLISRYAKAGGTAVDIGGGLYIDTLVQFTAADPETPPTPDVDGGDKLCIWLADNEEDPTQCTLMVTAGFVDSDDGYTIVATNYVTTTKLENNSWHRLQVKVLAGIDSEDTDMLADGFVVIIDGSNTVATTTCPIDSEVISEYTLNARAQRYMTVGNYSLFPSLVRKGRPGAGEITSLSFQGSGAVDNIAFTQGADIDPILIPQALEPVENGPQITYTGDEIEGVSAPAEAYGYEFENESNIGTAVGPYVTTATPLYGYAWYDGSTGSKTYNWEIVSGGDTPTNWPDDPTTVSDKTAAQAYGITGDLANANAAQLATWAKGTGNVAFADKGDISLDCFLLNIANNSSAADVQTAKDAFKVSISIVGETVTITTLPDGKTYNGTLTIYGSADLTTPKANWDAKTTGDKFFYGKLGL